MNDSFALLYNFRDEKLKIAEMVCVMMKVKFYEVSLNDYNQPLGALLGLPDINRVDDSYEGEELQEEMLLLHGFDGGKLQKFLIALQKLGIGRIDLKAMLTENNKTWSGLALYEELCLEREAFNKMEVEKNK